MTTTDPECRHLIGQLHGYLHQLRRNDWWVICASCGHGWRPGSDDIPEQVERIAAGIAGRLLWQGHPVDYAAPPPPLVRVIP